MSVIIPTIAKVIECNNPVLKYGNESKVLKPCRNKGFPIGKHCNKIIRNLNIKRKSKVTIGFQNSGILKVL